VADDVEKKGSPRKVERLVVTKAEAGQAGRSALHHAELRASLRGARGEDGEQVKLVAVFDHAEHLALSPDRGRRR
jgi:hypothetical protein